MLTAGRGLKTSVRQQGEVMAKKKPDPGLTLEEYEKVAPKDDLPELRLIKRRLSDEDIETVRFYPAEGIVECQGIVYDSLIRLALTFVSGGFGLGGVSCTDKCRAAELHEMGGYLSFGRARKDR